MKLLKENIIQIDQYLKSINIIFDDLRIELVDHIASAVEFEMIKNETAFDTAFSAYILENKEMILKTGKVDRKADFLASIVTFFNFLKSKDVIVFSVVSFILFKGNFFEFIRTNIHMIQLGSVLALILISLGWMVFFKRVYKKKFYAMENNFSIGTIYFNVFMLARVFVPTRSDLAVNLTLLYGIITVLFIWFIGRTTIKFNTRNKELFAVE
ncbi:hypothetical protein ACFSX9_07700 [Flavobacterium ardleyense]|uniref:Uncharacterized protein n=1 Tax=Flavobacterium ardleyense TaxID=2038737 RepID=A0ABW5Z767_9FLAO